jgi:hypothetical protein
MVESASVVTNEDSRRISGADEGTVVLIDSSDWIVLLSTFNGATLADVVDTVSFSSTFADDKFSDLVNEWGDTSPGRSSVVFVSTESFFVDTFIGRPGGFGGGRWAFDDGGTGGGARGGGGAAGRGGCFELDPGSDFNDVECLGGGGRGGGGGGIVFDDNDDDMDFWLVGLSEQLALTILSIDLSSESLRGRFNAGDVGGVTVSGSSRFGDFLDGAFNTKIASPSSTESKESCGGDMGRWEVIDRTSPPFTMDGSWHRNFSGINELARFSLYGLPKFTINFEWTRICADSTNSPVFGSKNANGMASSSTDQTGEPSEKW